MSRPFRLINLSHVNDPATTSLFPGDPEFRLQPVADFATEGYWLQYVQQGEHTGTHWGAPAHFDPAGLTADRLDVEDLCLPAVKIDIRGCAADYALTVDDLSAWERQHGRIPQQAAIILRTGWENHWGTDAFGTVHPGFGVDAVRWLLDTGRLGRRGALGTDAFSPDAGGDDSFAVSKLLYGEHRISLECLTNLAELPTTGAWVLAGGPLNRNGSGSAATIFGIYLSR
ncbi:cyclase family protein [Skermania sp. ID1734]|uniref:cyclase family protein n=1 Tax=Skermania sp. ID1734 TaxID=2597516 RepID=UPI00117EACBE|nr:cyclase family protein [Skermania sp. ID1734]TSE00016.1 cyclase family protein [Skermania sp. ID1734]